MLSRVQPVALGVLCGAFFVAAPFAAQADIPAFYTGTPYMGVAQQIPGHIELADLDLGGIDVAWNTDHNRMTDGPQSGDDYRADDLNLPNINQTNRFLIDQTWAEDFWEVDGTRYPSETDLHWRYMGASHVDDWIRLTVDVQQAGTYNVSSNWACANLNCGCSLWFNDGSDPTGPDDGINKSGVVDLAGTNDYHLWRAYPNFAQVELTAGLQVMTFRVENADHLQYGFLDFALVGGAGAGGAAGAAGAGGANLGGTGGVAQAGAGGAGGAAAGGGTGGAAGETTAQAGSSNTAGVAAGGSAAGGSTAVSSGGSAGSPTNGATPSEVSTKSGCAFSPMSTECSARYIAAMLMLSAALLRRRHR